MSGYGYYVSRAWMESHGPDADPSHDPYDCFACGGTGEIDQEPYGEFDYCLCDCWCHLTKDEREWFNRPVAQRLVDDGGGTIFTLAARALLAAGEDEQ